MNFLRLLQVCSQGTIAYGNVKKKTLHVLGNSLRKRMPKSSGEGSCLGGGGGGLRASKSTRATLPAPQQRACATSKRHEVRSSIDNVLDTSAKCLIKVAPRSIPAVERSTEKHGSSSPSFLCVAASENLYIHYLIHDHPARAFL